MAQDMHALQELDVERIAGWRESGAFFWLDLVDAGPDELAATGALLRWHPLLIEDLQHGSQRPKVEDFADHSLVIAYAVNPVDDTQPEVELVEHAMVVHGDYLVTVRPTDMDELARLRRIIAAGTAMSEAGLVHRVLDVIVDTTLGAADHIAQRIEELEERIDLRSTDDVLAELRLRRRELVSLRGVVGAQRDAVLSLDTALETIPGFDIGMRSHYRDVTDHARRAVDQLDASRGLLDAAFEAYYAMLAARQGAVSQRLTVISTIFLPLTFVTGFFGQNFGWMVDNVASRQDFLMWGVGTTIITALIMALTFRRLHWF